MLREVLLFIARTDIDRSGMIGNLVTERGVQKITESSYKIVKRVAEFRIPAKYKPRKS